MKHSLFFLFLLISVTCSGRGQIEQDSISLDSLWHELVLKKGGCLTGGQRTRDGKFGSEACVLTDNRRVDWSPFFAHPEEELREFLISKFADTSKTRIHTCPFYSATNGEVAVYCLTKIYLINWYDFEPFATYNGREISGSMDSEQVWLQAILEDPKQRKVLIEEWRKL